MDWTSFDDLIDAALSEDQASRDVTTLALVPPDRRATARLVAKAEGVVCGLPLAARLVAVFDADIAFEPRLEDGARVAPGVVAARLDGPAGSILSVERTMLNFVRRLSGVATLTARFVERIRGTGARIYDTRKTTPGWRELEKYAVRCGGGNNHRMSLADQALIKDNHLALLGRTVADGVGTAVRAVRDASPGLMVTVEVEGPKQLRAALTARPDVILLDNMTPAQVREAAELARRAGERRPLLEASGTITLDSVREYAEAGADRISIGALTHSAGALDLSLDVDA
jgi:nicotinate-nucleotide pyrophosphorylase (carboxylating)